MTLIIAFGNSAFMCQLSDRRLVSNGKPVDDESNKAALLVCENGRFITGFTGLARVGDFRTRKWLSQALNQCGPPDFTAKEILERFTKRANYDFNNLPVLRSIHPQFRRVSFVFSGFLDHHSPPLGAFALVSNYYSFAKKAEYSEAQDHFECILLNEPRPGPDPMTMVYLVGMLAAVTKADIDEIDSLLEKNVPINAILDAAVSIVRRISDRPSSHGFIGKQLTSAVIWRDTGKSLEGSYHPQAAEHHTFLPDIIYATHGVHLNVENIELEAVNPATTPPLSFPQVHKRQPCPCGSGKRYGHCHGKT